jgi:hypothetical protein
MNRIQSLLSATAVFGLIASAPVLAASPSQEFLDHFKGGTVTAAAPAKASSGNPSAEYLVALKGDTGGYVAGPKVQASSADPRQSFLDQLAVHPTVGGHDIRANLAEAK